MIFGARRGFSAGRQGISLRLDRNEADVLVQMLSQVDELVSDSDESATAADDPLGELLGTDTGQRPTDPALLRLFPDGYLDDDEAAGDFRRFTQRGLREVKGERVRSAIAVLDRIDDRGSGGGRLGILDGDRQLVDRRRPLGEFLRPRRNPARSQ